MKCQSCCILKIQSEFDINGWWILLNDGGSLIPLIEIIILKCGIATNYNNKNWNKTILSQSIKILTNNY